MPSYNVSILEYLNKPKAYGAPLQQQQETYWRSFSHELKQDIFTPHFQARSRTKTVSNGQKQSNKIWKIWKILENCSPQQCPVLGRGMEATVYDISAQHVLRIVYASADIPFKVDKNHIRLLPDPCPKIGNLGKALARIQISNSDPPRYDEIYLHRKVPGRKGSVNYDHMTWEGKIPPGLEEEFLKQYTEYLQTIASFPDTAYEELLRAIYALDQAGYVIDPSVTNLMIEPEQQRFYLVDYKDQKVALPRGMYVDGEANNLAYVMAMVVDTEFMERYAKQPSAEVQKNSREVLKKLLNAAVATRKFKLPGSNFYNATDRHQHCNNAFTPEETLQKVCGLPESAWTALKSKLEAILSPAKF